MSNTSISSKLGQCQICGEKAAKYKCPRCRFCTCSLTCVRMHKVQRNCNGMRNRVEMIPKENMDNLTLLSDYRFLEEIDHKLENGTRNPLRRTVLKSKEAFLDLPFHLKKLKVEAKKRRTVIEFMPRHFLKHQENSTRFSYADKKIRWHIKWVFPQADLTFTEKSVDEERLIVDLLRKYIEPQDRLDESESIGVQESEKLAYYQSASYRRIAVLFKSSLCDRDERYIEVFPSKSFKVNLANRKVVEYPVFYVVLRDHLDAYLDYDESDSEAMTFNPSDKITNTENNGLRNSDMALRKKLPTKIPQVKKKDGGLSFFDVDSDLSDE